MIGYYPGRRTTHTEAEAMRKLLLARYHRDGYAFCNIELLDVPVVADASDANAADPNAAATAKPEISKRKTLRVLGGAMELGPFALRMVCPPLPRFCSWLVAPRYGSRYLSRTILAKSF